MSHVKSFAARYTDEETIRKELEKIFPAGSGAMVYPQRGRYICMTPRELTRDEISQIKAAIKANHYDGDGR
jgi:hypothetical protein